PRSFGDKRTAAVYRPVSIERKSNPPGEPIKEIGPRFPRRCCRRSPGIEIRGETIGRQQDFGTAPSKNLQEAIEKIGAGRFLGANGRKVATRSAPGPGNLYRTDLWGCGTVTFKRHAQPKVTAGRAAHRAIPARAVEYGKRRAGPLIIGKDRDFA